jgi:hypothetical protein
MPEVTKYDHSKGEYAAVPGTEDFVRVHAEYTGGYDWVSNDVFYSPSARRYFWYQDSGCSCYGPMESVDSVEDFSNGDRATALRAWDEWAKGRTEWGELTADEVLAGRMAIRDFKES